MVSPVDTFDTSPDYILHRGFRLPPKEMRFGGVVYRDDDAYIRSGEGNVRLLQQTCGLSATSRVLDIGCGPARLLTGLLAAYGSIGEYVGIDVHKPSIDWAMKNLYNQEDRITFHWLNVVNKRYNAHGQAMTGTVKFPIPSDRFDVVVLFSVFSHMGLAHIRAYLPEIKRILAAKGKVYVTLFVEHGVPDEEENPKGYRREWSGPLHCVRLNRYRFEDTVYEAGLSIEYLRYGHTSDGQSSYVLTHPT